MHTPPSSLEGGLYKNVKKETNPNSRAELATEEPKNRALALCVVPSLPGYLLMAVPLFPPTPNWVVVSCAPEAAVPLAGPLLLEGSCQNSPLPAATLQKPVPLADGMGVLMRGSSCQSVRTGGGDTPPRPPRCLLVLDAKALLVSMT